MKKLILLCLLFTSLGLWAQDKYDIIVDRNGRGHFRTIQQAIDSVRAFDPSGLKTIYIRSGVYKEKLVLHSYLTNVKLIGEDMEKTIITYDDHANINKMGTFKTYSFLIQGNDIIVENLTIENSSLQLGQAVALHVEGDRVIFRKCRFLGHQDTIYAGKQGQRQYFEDCYIEGTTDFIFGPSTCWFERCEIFCKKNSYITAANTPENIEFGYVFNNCIVKLAEGVDSMYLGRPWRAHAMTLFMNTYLPKGIKPEGWHNWSNAENEKTTRYVEYNNSGEGANISKRVKWAKVLTPKEAERYTIANALRGCDNWNPTINK